MTWLLPVVIAGTPLQWLPVLLVAGLLLSGRRHVCARTAGAPAAAVPPEP